MTEKNKAVFLDRDGVINKEVHHLHRKEELELLPGVGEAIRRLNNSPYKVIVVTNQSVVARGMCSEDEVEQIHNELEKMLASEGARLDGIYYCPHHPEGKVEKYSKVCECRKPGTGLLEQVKADFDIDPGRSFLVGDSTSDIKAGNDAGCRTILVGTGYGGSDGEYNVRADYECKDLSEAADFIINLQLTIYN